MSVNNAETIGREIVNTRLLNASPAEIFKAWTYPRRPFQQFDMQPGGTWRFIMYGPKGVDHKNESVFVDNCSKPLRRATK